MYNNSAIFLMIIELYCRRLGDATSDITVDDYNIMPVPNLAGLNVNFASSRLKNRDSMKLHGMVSCRV